MKRFEIPEINVREFNRVSILTSSETTNVASAKEWLEAEKGISETNTTLATLAN